MKRQTRLSVPFLVLVLLASFVGTRRYLNRPPTERYVKVVQRSLPTAVTFYVMYTRIKPGTKDEKENSGLIGSGVFITDNGHILTCAHLFNQEGRVDMILVETYEGWILPAELLYKDDRRDLALVKVWDSYASYATLGRPGKLQEGQEVIAIGAPEGLKESVTTGVVSALHRDTVQYDMIQMSAPINPGNSGGPLFNLSGEVVGINSAISTNTGSWCGIGWSVSDDEINIFLANFRGLEKAVRSR